MRPRQAALSILIAAAYLLTATLQGAPGISAKGAAPSCFGSSPTIVGTSGPDVIRGTARADVIVGLAGNDVLSGLAGDDLLCGGRGNDTLRGAKGVDSLAGGTGEDECYVGWGGGRKVACDDPTILAAGDIACDPTDPAFNNGQGTEYACRQKATSDILVSAPPNLVAVLVLGDAQYEDGVLEDFMASYHPTWGRVRSITRPVPGNHDYQTPGAVGYFAYFGDSAGATDQGFYSFDLERWHFVALNSQCWEVGGCEAGNPQEEWLRQDLAASDAPCTLAFFHHPRFSSNADVVNGSVEAIWQALYDFGAELALNGHNHNYERFALQDPQGAADPSRGIREFVVGTGGGDLEPFAGAPRENSRVRNDQTFGVLEITLHPASYEWRFIPVEGSTFTDAGVGSCS
jgi:acid phosphatase type 7